MNTRAAVPPAPGVVTCTVTAVPLPAVLAPSIVSGFAMASSLTRAIVSLPAERLKVIAPSAAMSAIAWRRVFGPESALLVTTALVAALTCTPVAVGAVKLVAASLPAASLSVPPSRVIEAAMAMPSKSLSPACTV